METIKTNSGEIKGVDMGTYTIYKGIPYAKPPVGELRWKAPQPVEPWDGVLEAVKFPKRGWQENNDNIEDAPYWKKKLMIEYYADPSYTPEMGEDILYVNIWTPNQKTGEKLPVAFWIHGGGFGSGWSSEMEFDGEQYCKRGVILVTIGYRLGMLGNLAHEWLNEENPDHVSGNYGILDQIEALKWVHENIEAFGGDPCNITVFGQSAGAMSCQLLVSTDLTENLISKAIFQSGGCHNNILISEFTLEKSMQIGKEFVEHTGAKSLEELRQMPAEFLEQKVEEFNEMKQAGILFMPTVDGVVFKENTTECLNHNHVKNIPYVLGTNRFDLLVTPDMVEKGEKSLLYNGCIEWSQKMEEMNNNPSYVYYMTHDLPGDDWGAFHGAELWYMFGTLDRCWRPFDIEDYKLSSEMMDYWTSFMKTGVPSGENEWRPHTKEDPYIKIF